MNCEFHAFLAFYYRVRKKIGKSCPRFYLCLDVSLHLRFQVALRNRPRGSVQKKHVDWWRTHPTEIHSKSVWTGWRIPKRRTETVPFLLVSSMLATTTVQDWSKWLAQRWKNSKRNALRMGTLHLKRIIGESSLRVVSFFSYVCGRFRWSLAMSHDVSRHLSVSSIAGDPNVWRERGIQGRWKWLPKHLSVTKSREHMWGPWHSRLSMQGRLCQRGRKVHSFQSMWMHVIWSIFTG